MTEGSAGGAEVPVESGAASATAVRAVTNSRENVRRSVFIDKPLIYFLEALRSGETDEHHGRPGRLRGILGRVPAGNTRVRPSGKVTTVVPSARLSTRVPFGKSRTRGSGGDRRSSGLRSG